MCPKRAPCVMDQEDWRSGFFSVLLDISQDQVRFSELVCIALLPMRHYNGYRSALPSMPSSIDRNDHFYVQRETE